MDLNFGKALLNGRNYRDLSDDEILQRSKELLEGWMSGDHTLERPKLYDHYAILFLALVRRVQELEEKVHSLEFNSKK